MKKFNVETLRTDGRTYVNVVGLAEGLRETAEDETNKDIKEYMLHLSKQLLSILTKEK